uniref:Uncharacterized protein n=1 Tax=Arundo donax TaxID=35708 RepID=A0A0A9AT78_ARUDO
MSEVHTLEELLKGLQICYQARTTYQVLKKQRNISLQLPGEVAGITNGEQAHL